MRASSNGGNRPQGSGNRTEARDPLGSPPKEEAERRLKQEGEGWWKTDAEKKGETDSVVTWPSEKITEVWKVFFKPNMGYTDTFGISVPIRETDDNVSTLGVHIRRRESSCCESRCRTFFAMRKTDSFGSIIWFWTEIGVAIGYEPLSCASGISRVSIPGNIPGTLCVEAEVYAGAQDEKKNSPT